MKFTIKNMLTISMVFGLYATVVAEDGFWSYWNRAKSAVSQYLPARQQPVTATIEPVAEQPALQPYERPVIPPSSAATSMGMEVVEPGTETPPRSLSPELERYKEALASKAGLVAIQKLFPVTTADGADCLRTTIDELTDYIALVKGMYTRYNDPNREIDTKSQMQEAVYRLLQFKRLLVGKLPDNASMLREVEQEFDEWKHTIPFHTRHYEAKKGYRTQEEIFSQRREEPKSFKLPVVPTAIQVSVPGGEGQLSQRSYAPKISEVPHTITAEQFGGRTSNLGQATAMGYFGGMSPEQEAELRERMAPSSGYAPIEEGEHISSIEEPEASSIQGPEASSLTVQ
jgi:hypothetical protein